MAIERVGQFIEFIGDDGIRNVVRVTAIQWLCDSDEIADETFMTVANKTILVRAPLTEVRDALLEDPRPIRMMPPKQP
ncbi:hypothetical protein [Beijerinckia sp. L45]|uniref:hypothetical protein n=1 Tax=Beijerinckia sp. L45 TaxID=1641855 RepID=UPI00131DC6B0|nr:hypothetical protein [Beijerinckia sp. L45]